MSFADARQLLVLDVHPTIARLHAAEISELEREFAGFEPQDNWGLRGATSPVRELQRLVVFLHRYVGRLVERREKLAADFATYQQRYSGSASERERRDYMLDFARRLGATKRQLRADRRAFRRWFGHDAISERYRRRQAGLDRKIAFAVARLGVLSARLVRQTWGHSDPLELWRRMELEQLVRRLLIDANETPVRIEAFRCLRNAVGALPAGKRESSLNDGTLMYVYRLSLERAQDVWLQCEALSLLARLSHTSLEKALRKRLGRPGSDADLFVRCRAVRLAGDLLSRRPLGADLIELASRDPSPAVRQVAVEMLPKTPDAVARQLLTRFLRDDPEPAVRAAAVLVFVRLSHDEELVRFLVFRMLHLLNHEKDEFVLRVSLRAVPDVFRVLKARPENARLWQQAMVPPVTRLHRQASSLAVRRWAAQARERLWMLGEPEVSDLVKRAALFVRQVPEGQTRRVPPGLAQDVDDDLLGRSLAVLTQHDFGLDVERRGGRARVTRGHRFGFRLWRFVHESLNPGTDKRQAYAHTTGRVFRGTLRVPSGVLSELAETKVPGEPLFMSSEDGWRPYLPLVDELIDALDQPVRSGPVKIYTSEGVTEIRPPHLFWRRLRSRFRLTVGFARYARLRNWREGESGHAARYVDALGELGFSIGFRPHGEQRWMPVSADPSVVRFFPAALPIPALDPIERLSDYFFSVYENNLTHLLLFLSAMAAWFIGRHVWLSRSIARVRARMPLVIGGWGTRGKSGTERIKAALFNALGHSVVSKTTGCEAMFLHGNTHGQLREMFLFRPYDKATIWEQVNVFRIADRLGAHVFLWECMGLTPSYVAILQQQWMRDDFATITNTYPDHEDLQGPAGINIPQVMTNFIPRDATLLTTEEQMLPILRADAEAKNTRLCTAGWLEAGLLTPDVLARFPYAEHPYNIALVLRLAEELGVDRDFALKEMADRVVPDLGVLKASPVCDVDSRRLEFVNGMSANERFGCLGNWERMGFAQQDPYDQPAVWLLTVVNNRADRVPRSKVFASILVRDIAADVHVLIGTNLDGLSSYIREAWDEAVAEISLSPGDSSGRPLDVLRGAARRLRVPYEERHVVDRLRAMLQGAGLDAARVDQATGLWEEPERLRALLVEQVDTAVAADLMHTLERLARGLRQYESLQTRVETATDISALDGELHKQLWEWFRQKLVIVEDAHADGHQIIDQVIACSPPGLHSRIMGMQNIKGTGLDFVYRWQAWELCHQACETLGSRIPAEAEQGLRALSAFRDYNVLCETKVRRVVEEVRHGVVGQSETVQAELSLILANMDEALSGIRARLKNSREKSVGLTARVMMQVEAFLDAGDAVRRRKAANRIYRDLADERIGHERAALELQALNKRQKGGWLRQSIDTLLRRG